MESTPPPLQIARAAWHTRVQIVVFTWFAAALVVAAVRFDDWVWFLVHFLMLGAVSNALFIWSWHFTGAILRVPDQRDRADEIRRLLLLNCGIAGTVIGVHAEALPMIGASVAVVITAVVMHAGALRGAVGRALPSPYAFTVQAYIAACVLLVPGLLLGALMEALSDEDPLRPQLVLAHVALNLLGWVGLPILGTIVTLWPTMLRTRIAPNAARMGRQALPLLVTGVAATALAFAAGRPLAAVAGLAAYLAGFVRTLGPLLAVTRTKRPATFATWSTAAGMTWLFATVVGLLVLVVVRVDTAGLQDALGGVAFCGVVGVLQVLIGCMSYLVPAMAAGGPAIMRLRNDMADSAMVPRFALLNVGALLVLMTGGTPRSVGAGMIFAGFVWTLARIVLSVRTPAAVRVAEAESARVWVDDKERRRYPFGRR